MNTMKLWRWILLWSLTAGAVAAPPELQLHAADQQRLMSTPAGASDANIFDSAHVWTLIPIDAYAPDASVELVDDSGRRPLPRSTDRLFQMSAQGDAWRGVLVLNARGGFVAATVFGGTAIYRGENVAGTKTPSIEFRDLTDFLPAGVELSASCGLLQSMSAAILPSLASAGASARASVQAPAGALVQARLAIDTDNEFMNLKFGNNTTAANNYVAQLVALMSVVYERDLGVRLAIGNTTLRTTPDPYATDGTNTPAQLNEFGEFWRLNQGSVQRAFAVQLSGKSSLPNRSSGIAWLLTSGNYCASTGQVFEGDTFGHYGISQVFRFAGATAASDVSLVAHELGHNFGANHTHCTDTLPAAGLQPIDMCFNGEGGCYSGALSCPIETGGQGTLMSYCNFNAPSGANCGSVRQEFHPFHITQLSGRVLTNTQNGCMTPVVANETIFSNGFE